METKRFGRVDVDIKSAKDSGEFEAVLSAPTEDRDGEVVDAKAFDPLPEYIPIDVDHSMTVAGTVGSGKPFYDGDVLKFAGSFASTPLAQEVRTLVTEGHIRKMSVAFMNAQRTEDEDGTLHIRKAELLNAAIVAIPSNRDASILAAKALDAKTSKGATLQDIHDLSVRAGAACEGKHAATDDTKTSTTIDPEDAPAPAAALPADVIVELANAELVLADLA